MSTIESFCFLLCGFHLGEIVYLTVHARCYQVCIFTSVLESAWLPTFLHKCTVTGQYHICLLFILSLFYEY